MLTMQSVSTVKGVTTQEVFDFMLNCTDEDYQQWWTGTHLAFHTIKRYPSDIGNIVYFDEYVGKYRLKFQAVITEIVPGRKIIWQMKKWRRLPAWLNLECEAHSEGLRITHTITVGFKGIGRIFDTILGIVLSEDFAKELDNHAQTEFPLLGELLVSRRTGS